jgi:hypothetical protein
LYDSSHIPKAVMFRDIIYAIRDILLTLDIRNLLKVTEINVLVKEYLRECFSMNTILK